MSNPFDFAEDPPGTFEMNVSVVPDDGTHSTVELEDDGSFTERFVMHRNAAEELLFQMAFILGYKVA